MGLFSKDKLVKVGQTVEEVKQQIETVLEKEGFKVSAEMRQLAGSLLQHETSVTDSFSPKGLAAAMRRLIFNQHLFAIIEEARKEQKDAAKAASETKDVTPSSVQPEATKLSVVGNASTDGPKSA